MRTHYLLLAMAVAMTAAGCKKNSSTTPTPPIEVLPGFVFATSTPTNINIGLVDMTGAPVSGVGMEFYASNPVNPENGAVDLNVPLLGTASTDVTGMITLNVNIPKLNDTVYVMTASAGYINPTMIVVNDQTEISVKIAPAGYGVTASAAMNVARDGGGNGGNTKNANPTLMHDNIYSLSDWDNNGVPSYRTKVRDVVSAALNQNIITALPEGKNMTLLHPEYFTNAPVKSDISIIEDANVWVTFLSEGAGYTTPMGYYVYKTNNPPTSAAQITQRYIIFPNVSFSGSGGGLTTGDKVELVYYDGERYTTAFPAGTSIGWFILSNGFQSQKITNGLWQLYSTDAFNPSGLKQCLVLRDPSTSTNYITFEDILTSNGSCDKDFNDVIFYCTSNPIEAIDTHEMPEVTKPKDTDKDGVPDALDAYPTDPTLAYDSYYPAKDRYATIAYEDLWPARGDYDFNDVVVDVNFHNQLNAQNNVVNILPTFILRAVGSSYHNAFAFGMNAPSGLIQSVTGAQLSGGIFNLASNGVENGNVTAVIPVFWDGYDLFGNKPFTNTYMSQAKMTPITVSMVIKLITPTPQATLGIAPYDPFIVINGERAREVHLMNKRPTAHANLGLLGTQDDISSTVSSTYYIGKNGLPWALLLPNTFTYPTEKSNILNTYLHFSGWAQSGGTSFIDWYSNTGGGYRNAGNLYTK